MALQNIPILLIAVVLGISSGGCSSHRPLLTFPQSEDDPVTFATTVNNHSNGSNWEHAFMIYVDHEGDCCEGRVPIQGTYHQQNDVVTFHPDFPFSAGTRYLVRVAASHAGHEGTLFRTRVMHEGQEFLESRFALATKQVLQPAMVVKILPTGDELPANLLRFYIYFSSPMRRGFSDTSVTLIDEQGLIVSKPFMQFKQELWDPEQKRLTMIFDPGRIKRGVSTNLKPALQEGKSYRLIIDEHWEDAQGNLLQGQYEKLFRVNAALRSNPDPTHWEMTLPPGNSKESVNLTFLRPFDHALLRRMITLRSKADESIEGSIKIDQAETHWQFTPTHPWKEGQYVIHVDARLEDVTGNNLQGLFDRPVKESLSNAVAIELPFLLGAQGETGTDLRRGP
jgi:hypothetical protein